MPSSSGRRRQIEREKAEFPDHMLSTELAKYVNISDRLFRRWQQSGKIPPPAQRTPSGWGLWSPEQQLALLRQRLGQEN